MVETNDQLQSGLATSLDPRLRLVHLTQHVRLSHPFPQKAQVQNDIVDALEVQTARENTNRI